MMLLITLYWLLIGHFVADYPLQGDYMSASKNRHTKLGAAPIWVHSLTAHAMIHGAAVSYVTGWYSLGMAEAVAHALIDFLKCEERINYHQDQMLHILCKLVWVGVLVSYQGWGR